MYKVILRLADGDRVEAGSFSEPGEAQTSAERVVERLAAKAGRWPRFGDRFVRPEAVVSVDVVGAQPGAWEGSPLRRAFAESDDDAGSLESA